MMPDKDKTIAVIIPTFNRAEILEKCLDALSNQTVPLEEFEVIVADDGSADDTRERTARFESVFPHITYFRQPNGGQNAARNNAVKQTGARLLLFINDDTVSTPSMVEEHLKAHAEYPEENVAILGRVTMSPDVPPSLFARLHLDPAFALLEGKTELDWRAFITCNVSMKRSFLVEYGPFDESLRYNDDLEIAERLSHHGLRILYRPQALGYHYHYLTEESYLNLARLSGTTLAVWYKKSPHLKKELASIGFYLTAPTVKRLKYLIGNMLVNKMTIPCILSLARRLAGSGRENLSLMLYKKIYKALERENIRDEMRRR